MSGDRAGMLRQEARLGARLMAELQLRLAIELELFEAEHQPNRSVIALALIDFAAGVAQMDGVPKALMLALLDACPEWEEPPHQGHGG
jgi:hypothetical protein